MEVLSGNQSFNGSFYDYDNSDDEGINNEHEKTFVTVHVDSFNEQDFTNFLNCLDTLRESNKKRKSREKVIKNYCVQVPYIDNSMRVDDEEDEFVDFNGTVNEADNDKFEKKCDEMKHNISQMFSYFDEDVQLNLDEIDEIKTPKISRKIESRPVIRGVVKKRNAPCPSPSILNKNQVDKLMNEFNRVKINYYSKDNKVEFTNIDYFYCESDLESLQNEKIGKLDHSILKKFQSQDDGDKIKLKNDTEIVPRNAVRDKISMFSKMDLPYKAAGSGGAILTKSLSEPITMSSPQQNKMEKMQRNAMIKNTACANKNINKCYIKDINNSLSDEQNLPELYDKLLARIINEGKLLSNCTEMLMSLEHIVNKFGMSLLFTLNGLLSDNAFSLGGRDMTHLALNIYPSLEKFNETFNVQKIDDCNMKNVELSVIDVNQIQLQMHVQFINRQTKAINDVRLNIIFMAQYDNSLDGDLMLSPSDSTEKSFFIYFTSFFEVTRFLLHMAFGILLFSCNFLLRGRS